MSERPIGYWVKLLDRLIEGSFDVLLGDTGLGRRHWQLLNVLGDGPASRAEIDRALAPFRPEPTPGDRTGPLHDRPVAGPGGDQPATGISTALDELVRRGWARAEPDDRWTRTPAGDQATAALRERVAAHRRQITDGVSPEAYRTTLATLTRMCTNLDPAGSVVGRPDRV